MNKSTLYGKSWFGRIPHRWKFSLNMKVATVSLLLLQETFDKLDVSMICFCEEHKTYLYKYYDAN